MIISIALCMIASFFISHFMPAPVVATISSCTILLLIFMILIDHAFAKRHPLARKIHAAIKQQHTDKHLLLNVSGHSCNTLFSSKTTLKLSLQYKECEINLFSEPNGESYLCLSHPNNDISAIMALWQQLSKTQLKFQTFMLAASPNQLSELPHLLSTEWQFYTRIMQTSKQVMLTVTTEDITQACHAIKAYGILPPTIIAPPYLKLTHIFHRITVQIHQMVQSIFSQRNELCLCPPISQKNQSTIFLLPSIISSLKPHLLSSASGLLQHNIPLSAISILISSPPKRSYLLGLSRYQYLFSRLLLTLITLGFILTVFNITVSKNIQNTLRHDETPQLVQHLNKINGVKRYHHIQKEYLTVLKNRYLEHFSTDEQLLFERLLTPHPKVSSGFHTWVVDILTQHTLDEQYKQFLVSKWVINHTQSEKTLTLSIAAKTVETPYIHDICYYFDHIPHDQCAAQLHNIKTYYDHENQLLNIEETLLPLNYTDYQQVIRQLSYFKAHPQQLGEAGKVSLQKTMLQLRHTKQQRLLTRAKNTASIIHMLQSELGQHILQHLLNFYTALSHVETNEEAHQFLQTIYLLEDHSLRQLLDMQQGLSEHQARWLEGLFKPTLDRIAKKATTHLKDTWNHDILPHIKNASIYYPFNPESSKSISSKDMFALFGKNQILDTFYQNHLQSYVQLDDGSMITKPLPIDFNIPNPVLMSMIYTQLIQSAIDIKPDHMHASWAANINTLSHPIQKISLHSSDHVQELNPQNSVVLHWDSRYHTGIDVYLESGKKITLIKHDTWSLLRFIGMFEKNENQYHYQDNQFDWALDLQLSSQKQIDLLSDQIFYHFPQSPW